MQCLAQWLIDICTAWRRLLLWQLFRRRRPQAFFGLINMLNRWLIFGHRAANFRNSRADLPADFLMGGIRCALALDTLPLQLSLSLCRLEVVGGKLFVPSVVKMMGI
jgi:hypothetical protein